MRAHFDRMLLTLALHNYHGRAHFDHTRVLRCAMGSKCAPMVKLRASMVKWREPVVKLRAPVVKLRASVVKWRAPVVKRRARRLTTSAPHLTIGARNLTISARTLAPWHNAAVACAQIARAHDQQRPRITS